MSEKIDLLAEQLKSHPHLMKQVRAERYKRDLRAFIEASWEIIEPGTPYSHNWHIDYLAEEVLAMMRGALEGGYPDKELYPNTDWDELDKLQKKLCINVPTRSMKTLLVSVFIPVWLLIHNPSVKIATISYVEDIAIDINVKRRQIIESNWFKEHFGDIVSLNNADHANKMMIETDQKGLLYTASIGGKLTGRGADIIILDDPQKPAEMDSEADRQRAIKFVTDTLPTRLNNQNTGVTIVIQQRLHTDDLTGFIKKQYGDVYRYVDLQLIFEEDREFVGPITGRRWSVKEGEALWPERVDTKSVEALRKALGSRNFAAQQQQRPTPDGSSHVSRSWFEHTRYEGLPDEWIAHQKKYRPDFFNSLQLVISVDSNYATVDKKTKGKDFVGLVVMAYDPETERAFLLEARQYQWTFTQSLNRLYDYRERYKNLGFNSIALLIESKANGGPILEILQKNIAGVIPYDPGIRDKESRLKSTTPYMESQNVYLPSDNVGVDWVEKFLHQLLSFPFVEHDDMVDAFSQGLIYLFTQKRDNEVDYNIYF